MGHKLKPFAGTVLLAALLLIPACAVQSGQTGTASEPVPTMTHTSTPTPVQGILATYQAVGTLGAAATQQAKLTPSATVVTPFYTSTATFTPSPTSDFNPPAATYTPPPQAVCPQPNPDVMLDERIFDPIRELFPNAGKEPDYTYTGDIPYVPYEESYIAFHQVETGIAAYLNQGGMLSQLQDLFAQYDVAAEPPYLG